MSQKMLQRRQSSREMRVGERLEMRDLHGKLIVQNGGVGHTYGATNVAFDDLSPRLSGRPVDSVSPIGEEKEFKADNADEESRESWDNKLQFFLATVGYAVGLGSVWRFPYLAQKNGGGAFLIPYMIMLALEGVPIFYLELAIGQRLRKGAIGLWNEVSPYMGGIGIACAVVSFNVALYYNTIIAWCLFYFFQSFQSTLPWAECPKTHYANNSYLDVAECSKSSPTQYFWYRVALDTSPDINHSQSFNWRMALCLLVAWILCYMCMVKGIASSGKVVYFTAPFPYVVLIIFFVRGMMLPGMEVGVAHLFTPDWNKLFDPVVWLEAGTQIFFSMGLAFGGLIAFSSYNPVHNNCFRDAITLSMTNCCTAIFAAIVVFSVLGFKAHMKNEQCERNYDAILMSIYNTTEVDPAPAGVTITPVGLNTSIAMPQLPICDLKQELRDSASGTGLAFIAFTEAINEFPWAPVWAMLFFLMLFTLGIDSQFGTLEGAVTSIVDMNLFPNLRKEILTGVICLISFLISLIFAHGAGSYIFALFDDYAGNIPLLVIAFCECISVTYVYGVKRFADDIEMMTGRRPSIFWLFCWKYVSPTAMVCILLSSLAKIAKDGSSYEIWLQEEGRTVSVEWPLWANILIAFLILTSVLWIPGVAVAKLCGWTVVADDTPAWFPAEELREFYNIEPHKVTTCERWLFCMKEEEPEEEV